MLVVFFAHRRGHGLAASRRSQGLLPAGGYRPALGLDRGAPGHLVRRHGRRCSSRSPTSFQRLALCRACRLDRRRRRQLRAQFRAPVRRAEAEGRAAGPADGAGRPPARAARRSPASATFMTPVQNLQHRRPLSKSQYQFVRAGPRPGRSSTTGRSKLADAMGRDPRFADVTSDLQNNAPQATLVVDRDKANSLGISADQLRSTLYSGFGIRQVSTIYATGDSYQVMVEFDPASTGRRRARRRARARDAPASSSRSARSRGSSARSARSPSTSSASCPR